PHGVNDERSSARQLTTPPPVRSRAKPCLNRSQNYCIHASHPHRIPPPPSGTAPPGKHERYTMKSSMTRRNGRRASALLGSVVIGALALTGCSSSTGGESSTDGGIEPMTLTLGHAYAVDSLQHRAAEQLAEKLDKASDGAITLEVYPSAQMGSWEEMQEG